jgi:Tol biopolymer transport system component
MKTSTRTVLIVSVVALVAVICLLVLWLTTRNSHRIAGVNAAAPPIKVVESGWKASWSPDGQQIVFCGKGGVGLQVLDFRTQTTATLGVRGSDPAWSPAGPLIAFVRQGPYDATSSYLREEVWLAPLKDGTPRRLARGGFPSWSPDGQVLYVHSRADNQILAFKANEPDTAPAVFYDQTPSWYFTVAPDGRRVAFGSREKLEIRDRETGQVTLQWPTPGNRGLLPAWSPDGKVVAFGGFGESRLGVWILDVRTGRAVPVIEGLFTMPAWSAGGHWLAIDERTSGGNSVWLVGRPYLDQLLKQSRDADPSRR